MIVASLFLCSALVQQGNIESVQTFEGGNYDQYVSFLRNSRALSAGLTIYQRQIFGGMGPARWINFSDGTASLKPSFDSILTYHTDRYYPFLKAKLLPDPFCRPFPAGSSPEGVLSPLDGQDHIREVKLLATKEEKFAPRVDGDFQLVNKLSQLEFRVDMHPFFNDMQVRIRSTGTPQPEILSAIAQCVGGKIRKEGTSPTTYFFEPDVEEIRQRALNTILYFCPSSAIKSTRIREELYYNLVKSLTTSEFRQWIDCARRRIRVPVDRQVWAKEVLQYRDDYYQDTKAISKRISPDDYKSRTVFVEFGERLGFGIILIGADGKSEWI